MDLTSRFSDNRTVYGEFPVGDVVMAACDTCYMEAYAPAFLYSMDKIDKNVHLHIVNPTQNDINTLNIWKATQKNELTFSFEDVDFKVMGVDPRSYYASARFLIGAQMLWSYHGVIPRPPSRNKNLKLLMLDIDCFANQPFDFPEGDIGLFFRNYEADPGMKIAAGITLFGGTTGYAFLHSFTNLYIQMLDQTQWFIDQYLLWKVYNYAFPGLKYHRFDQQFMDWEFNDTSKIWTGKGPRKHNNEKYVRTMEELTHHFTARNFWKVAA